MLRSSLLTFRTGTCLSAEALIVTQSWKVQAGHGQRQDPSADSQPAAAQLRYSSLQGGWSDRRLSCTEGCWQPASLGTQAGCQL